VLPFILIPARTLCGQVFQVGAGSSSLFQAHGGSLTVRGTNYDGWVGIGSLDGFTFGAFLRTRYRGYTLGFGDDTVSFRLPTDVFDNGHYFMGRGVGIGRQFERVSVYGFAGATSIGYGAPFFRGAQARSGIGLLFVEGQLAPKLRAFSRNVLSAQQTTINGLEWRPRTDLRLGVAGGVGASRGYFASSLSADRDWISVKAAYVGAGNQFRRIVVPQPLLAEVDRENILVVLRPKPFVSVTAGHQNFLQPLTQRTPGIRATVDQLRLNLYLARFRFGVGKFGSRVVGVSSTGSTLSLGRDILGRLQVDANLFHNRPGLGPTSTVLVGTLREVVSPRLSLLQVVTNSNGRPTMSFGGNFLSNRITVGVEYQTLYVPFRTGNQFKQALVLNLRLNPFGNVQVNAGTFVAPDGSVKYTVSGSEFLYRNGGISGGPPPTTGRIHKFVVHGRVVDEQGAPLAGATLRVDGEVAFTDSQGEFFVRKSKRRSYDFHVLPNEFLTPGRFEVISAPEKVTAEPEDMAKEISVVVRRLPSRPR
jgi:hypothetical protein